MINLNNLKQIRAKVMLSKAELARKAGVSVLTITRVEQGMECRMETKRKILQALGHKITDKNKIFPD
jgi:predicted transcriptional regulator